METASNNPKTQDELDTMSASKFNAKIISNPSLYCTECKHFLRPPVMFVPNDVGNVCNNCNVFGERAVHNTALENVMKSLIWPCSFSTNGCNVKLDYVTILKHESVCLLRNYCCPLKTLAKCEFKSSKLQLLKHIISHSTVYQSISNNFFTFHLNTSNVEEESEEVEECIKEDIFFFSISRESFIFRTFIDSAKLYYKIYYLGTCEEVNTYRYKISQINCEDIANKFTHGYLNITDAFNENFFQPLDFSQLQFINLELCRLLATDKKKFSFTIHIKLINDCTKKMDTALLPALDCPICKNRMRPPIYQCDVGHSICNACILIVAECPICRTEFLECSLRNYALESIANQLYFPCVNCDTGCNVNLLISEIEDHENTCTYKVYKCAFCSCEFSESTIISHLKSVHTEKILFQSCQILSESFIVANKTFYIVAFNRIFQVKVTQANGHFDWSINLLGKEVDDITYDFEIGGIIKQNISNNFVYANIELKSMTYDRYYLHVEQCAKPKSYYTFDSP